MGRQERAGGRREHEPGPFPGPRSGHHRRPTRRGPLPPHGRFDQAEPARPRRQGVSAAPARRRTVISKLAHVGSLGSHPVVDGSGPDISVPGAAGDTPDPSCVHFHDRRPTHVREPALITTSFAFKRAFPSHDARRLTLAGPAWKPEPGHGGERSWPGSINYSAHGAAWLATDAFGPGSW